MKYISLKKFKVKHISKFQVREILNVLKKFIFNVSTFQLERIFFSSECSLKYFDVYSREKCYKVP